MGSSTFGRALFYSGVSGFSGTGGGGGSGNYDVSYGTEIDFLGAATDVEFTVDTGYHVWIEEVGIIVTTLNLDGGSISTQPTIRAGIVSSKAKYLAAQLCTLLTAAYKRERYVTLLQDDGESNSDKPTFGMTVAGAIAGGGGSKAYKGTPYIVWRKLVD